MRKAIFTLALALAAVAVPATAQDANIWSNDWEGNQIFGPFPGDVAYDEGGGSEQSALSYAGLGTLMHRNDTSGTSMLVVTGLGGHSALHLSFDLAFIDSWDSTDGGAGPDILFVNIGGQSYQWTVNSASGTVFDVGPGTVLSTGSNLGYAGWNDTIVHYDFLIPHTAPNFFWSINFGGAGFQGGMDESWGLDNVSLSAIPAGGVVPEPAAWALMIAGFGLVGATLRRRTAAIA